VVDIEEVHDESTIEPEKLLVAVGVVYGDTCDYVVFHGGDEPLEITSEERTVLRQAVCNALRNEGFIRTREEFGDDAWLTDWCARIPRRDWLDRMVFANSVITHHNLRLWKQPHRFRLVHCICASADPSCDECDPLITRALESAS